ncbi:MAG: hypothetical protein EXR76_02080 [Myxococcales bacterium]|nr:hypothetical protein [Myxococcales bacterium]
MRLQSLALLVIFLLWGPSLALGEVAPLDVVADTLEYDQKLGLARFVGHVVAKQGGLSFSCTSLTVRYRPDGGLDTLDALGPVTVNSEHVVATAKSATWSAASGLVTLLGSPELRRGDDLLSGERILLHPETGKVTVIRARGQVSAPRFRLPTSASPGSAPHAR